MKPFTHATRESEVRVPPVASVSSEIPRYPQQVCLRRLVIRGTRHHVNMLAARRKVRSWSVACAQLCMGFNNRTTSDLLKWLAICMAATVSVPRPCSLQSLSSCTRSLGGCLQCFGYLSAAGSYAGCSSSVDAASRRTSFPRS